MTRVFGDSARLPAWEPSLRRVRALVSRGLSFYFAHSMCAMPFNFMESGCRGRQLTRNVIARVTILWTDHRRCVISGPHSNPVLLLTRCRAQLRGLRGREQLVAPEIHLDAVCRAAGVHRLDDVHALFG